MPFGVITAVTPRVVRGFRRASEIETEKKGGVVSVSIFLYLAAIVIVGISIIDIEFGGATVINPDSTTVESPILSTTTLRIRQLTGYACITHLGSRTAIEFKPFALTPDSTIPPSSPI